MYIDFLKLNIFGIRHLSPSGAYHLKQYLNEKKPKIVLVEGPADANELIDIFKHKDLKPPFAILNYTTEYPISTSLYPFAKYSPEYVCIKWALDKKLKARFIDLDSCYSLVLHKNIDQNIDQNMLDYYNYYNDIYAKLAELSYEHNYDTYWERFFEHNLNKDSYLLGVESQSTQIRELVSDLEFNHYKSSFAYNQIRESYMKRNILKVFEEGYSYDDIVVVCGAYHVSGLKSNLEPMTDEQISSLPNKKSQVTLMPYSYYKLSSRSGYGAGNVAPNYFEMMYNLMEKNQLEKLPYKYMTQIAKLTRDDGNLASTASAIEAVRLSLSLASLKDGSLPTLKDLHDAAITCIGEGEISKVSIAFAKIDIGKGIGKVPDGIKLTPIQQDFNYQLSKLKLGAYKTDTKRDIILDLRENRRVKSTELAFIDLNRSIFFNRLEILKINFTTKDLYTKPNNTWNEIYILCWTPETEIQIVEANLKGETIEIAAAYEIAERLLNATSIGEVSELVKCTITCNLLNLMDDIIITLQKLSVDTTDFLETAKATYNLYVSINYSDLRKIDTSKLMPILLQLFFKACIILEENSDCDNKAAEMIIEGINLINLISDDYTLEVNREEWYKTLEKLALDDSKNAILCGYAFSISLEHNKIDENKCEIEISRRFSPAVPISIGAGFFEGLSKRNRYMLLSRIYLWRCLNDYIINLDKDEFYKALVYLRRAFSNFNSNEKTGLTDLLSDFWELDASELLLEDLTEDEQEQLSDLNDFDFGDLI